MKWKQRVVFCGITALFVCSVVFLLQALPQVKVSSLGLTGNGKFLHYGDNTAHMSAIRKRLNKSNYTSEDFSPEKGDADINRAFQARRASETRKNKDTMKFYSSSDFVNYTDSDVDYLLRKLENLNKEIYNFNKLRKMTYEQLIENYKHGVKKGAYLPAYKTYEG